VDTEKSGGLRNVAVAVVKDTLNVLPLDSSQARNGDFLGFQWRNGNNLLISRHDLIRIGRLGQKVVGTNTNGRESYRDTAVSGQDDDGGCFTQSAQTLDNFEASHTRKAEIHDSESGRLRLR